MGVKMAIATKTAKRVAEAKDPREYDYEGDMAKMAADPKTQEWWDVCGPLQRPVNDRADGEWWASIPEVFHVD
jgi:L-rhamnose mutarotase